MTPNNKHTTILVLTFIDILHRDDAEVSYFADTEQNWNDFVEWAKQDDMDYTEITEEEISWGQSCFEWTLSKKPVLPVL